MGNGHQKYYVLIETILASIISLYCSWHFKLEQIMKPKKKPVMKKTIGLLGGSFNPAHQGHVHITLTALKCFKLDEIWWIISPGNPLKGNGPAPMKKRINEAKRIMNHPRVRIMDVETQLSSSYTSSTLAHLISSYPRNQFVWLMGADNLQQLDKWQNWRSIMNKVPIGILARPSSELAPLRARAARIYRSSRIPNQRSRRLALSATPSWCFAVFPMSHLSSTKLRND